MRAVQITEFGGPEVLKVSDIEEPVAGDGQVLITVDRAGINYADTHQVENSYLSKTELPLIPGGEVVGHTADGRRVVALVGSGGYAEKAVAHAPYVFDVPEGVSDGQALALVLQGTTAWHLLKTSTHLQPGESVLVHAGAGGVGSLAVQLAKLWGAGRVIATASSEDKRKQVLELGADAAIDGDAGRSEGPHHRGERRQARRHRAGDGRRAGVRRIVRGAGPVRPPRHLRCRVPAVRRADRPGPADEGLEDDRRLLAGRLLRQPRVCSATRWPSCST